jgi:hypothetical protein
VPDAISVAVNPDTVQTVGVIEDKVTARFELAVGATVNFDRAYSVVVMGANVMLW